MTAKRSRPQRQVSRKTKALDKVPAGEIRVSQIHDLLAVFRDVHQHGEQALRNGNLKAFAEAIAVERSLIDEHRNLTKKQQGFIEQERPKATSGKPLGKTRRK